LTSFRHDNPSRRGSATNDATANLLRDAVRALILELLASDPEIQQAVSSAPGFGITQLLDTAAFAELKGLNRDTVARMVREGRIPGAQRVGREWRFPADDLRILPKVQHRSVPQPPSRRRRAPDTSASDAMLRMAREMRGK
jgi:excisionase family DNA binding protein